MLDYLVVGGISFGLAYWIAGTGTALWRSIAGALLGFIIGWVGGTAIFASVLSAGDFGLSSFDRVIGRNFWFAFAGAGYGVHRARKKLKATNTSLSNAPQRVTVVKTTTNDAYAEALAEIDEGRIDKGTWARSFADSGGDGGKAKANYIKARAESIAVAAVRVNTRPPIAQDAGIEVTGGGQPQPTTLRPSPVTKSFATSPIEIVVWVVLVLGIFGWWQYQEQAKRQEVAARPVQTGPDWDKGVITAPENASAQDLYLQKVRAIQERVKRGELSSVDGETSLEPPKNLAQWPSAESLKLENSQTWWRKGTKQFNVHVQNTTPYELTTLALDFGQQGCESAVAKRRFYVALRQVVTSGSQALLSFTPPFAVSDTPNNCLIVSSAWQPVKAIPAKAQAARLAATTNDESGKERAQNKQVQADLDAIAQRAVRDYPYLDTPAGQEVLDKIVEKRDEFIQQGQYPSVALTNAVNAFAPANAPRPSQEKKTLPVPESGDKGNHPGSDPKCRWVTPQEWSCK